VYIFIDTQIYLDYSRMSSDTLVSLEKLLNFIKREKGSVKLVLPAQIENEFYRNKNRVIGQSLEVLKSAVNVLTNLSRLSADDKIKDNLEKIHKGLEAILTDKKSYINKLIDSLFELAKKYEDDDVFEKAYKRMVRGNPPGKSGSIGDAIAWEILLENCIDEPLYVISKDGDWADEREISELKTFLSLEWKKRSSEKIFLFRSIGDFLNKVSKAKISKEVIQEEKSIPITTAGPYVHYPMYSTKFDPAQYAIHSTSGGTISYAYPSGKILSSVNDFDDNFIPITYEPGVWFVPPPGGEEGINKK
jgi:hypothetical protein